MYEHRDTAHAEDVEHVAVVVAPRVLAVDAAQLVDLRARTQLWPQEAAAQREHEVQPRPLLWTHRAAVQVADEVRALSVRLQRRVVVHEAAVDEHHFAYEVRLEVRRRRRRTPRRLPQQRDWRRLRRRVRCVGASIRRVDQIARELLRRTGNIVTKVSSSSEIGNKIISNIQYTSTVQTI